MAITITQITLTTQAWMGIKMEEVQTIGVSSNLIYLVEILNLLATIASRFLDLKVHLPATNTTLS